MLTALPLGVLPLKARAPFPKKAMSRQQLPQLLVLPFLLLKRQRPVLPLPRRQTEGGGLYIVYDDLGGRRAVGSHPVIQVLVAPTTIREGFPSNAIIIVINPFSRAAFAFSGDILYPILRAFFVPANMRS
jgi:hypothetical protein